MPVQITLISTFIAELLCFGKSNTHMTLQFSRLLLAVLDSESNPLTTHKMAPTYGVPLRTLKNILMIKAC